MTLEEADQNEPLRPVLHRVLVAREEEKRAAALTLHDEIAQGLALVSLHLSVMRKQSAADPAGVAAVIPEAQAVLRATQEKIRALEFSLYPKLVELSVIDALKGLIRRLITEQKFSITYFAPAALQSERRVSIGLYRAVESLFTTSGLRADAEWSISLTESPPGITMSIAETSPPIHQNGSLRIDALFREIVSAHGGAVILTSPPTRIEIIFPQ